MNSANRIENESETAVDDFVIDADFDDVSDPMELLDIANDNYVLSYN